MSYIDILLHSREIEKCPLPLWKLKITDTEFEDLKQLLEKRTHIVNNINPFNSMRRECTLFFAEYWRRIYVDGSHSKQMVYNALGSTSSLCFCNEFYEAACLGAKMLKIETYDGGKSEILNDMLYQGGLPMKLVTTADINSRWGRFVKDLVFRNINFDELNLGVVALNHKGLHQYCSELCNAVDSKDFTLLPYWCENEYDPGYQFLLNKFTSIKRSYRLSNPFTLDWEFIFDRVDNIIRIKYNFRGVQRLPNVFCEQNHLQIKKFLTLNVTENGKCKDPFDYLDGFCRHDVCSKHSYNSLDTIAVYLQGIDQPLIKESLDLSVPHLLAESENGTYCPSNKIGKEDSVIIVPKGWRFISSEDGLNITQMHWNDTPFLCIWLPSSFSSEIVLESEDGRLSFSGDTHFSWTEVSSLPLSFPNVIEPVYNASSLKCFLCSDGEDVPIRRLTRNLEFRNKWSDKWSATPSYGEIFVRPKTEKDEYITHQKIVNIGDTLTIKTIEAEKTRCKIEVKWPYGHVKGPEDAISDGDKWIIERKCSDGIDRRHIEFTFTPFDNKNNSFILHIRAPFEDFTIQDNDGITKKSGCMIPYSDVDKYTYYIAGKDVKRVKINDKELRLRWYDDNLHLEHKGGNCITIPYEGSLTRIIGSREDLRAMLDKTSYDMLHASVFVSFDFEDGTSFSFTVKDAPYTICHRENFLYVLENSKTPIRYNHALKLLKIDDPSANPVPVKPNEIGIFQLPDEVKDWGNTLVIGRSRGRILPRLINTNNSLSNTDRTNGRIKAIDRINRELSDSNFGSPIWKRVIGWFDRCNSEDIPASSLLDLFCLQDNSEFLIKFALVVYARTSVEDRESLDDRLLEMAKDLSFQWYWLIPVLKGGMTSFINTFLIEESWNSEFVRSLFIEKIYRQDPVHVMEHLSNMQARNDAFANTFVNYCLIPLIEDFHEWLIQLCEKSMSRPLRGISIDENSRVIISDIVHNNMIKDINLDYYVEEFVSINQDLDESTKLFFSQFHIRGKKSINEIWLLQRVKCVAEHLRGNINLFSQDGSIRRSIIFCYNTTTRKFLLELNNELAKK